MADRRFGAGLIGISLIFLGVMAVIALLIGALSDPQAVKCLVGVAGIAAAGVGIGVIISLAGH